MEDHVGSEEELEAFCRVSPEDRRASPSLRGVLVEIATTGILRYDWRLVQVLLAYYLDKVLTDYEAEIEVEVGPRRPLSGGETPEMLRHRLKVQLADTFPDEAPFTIQRLAELLLEPHKHYTRLDKLALALEKLLNVTSTVSRCKDPPARPKLKDLAPVNCNPRNPHAQQSQAAQATPENGMTSVCGSADQGFGLASAVLASSTRESSRQATPELEEALGHLNEAGVAARAAPQGPTGPNPNRMDVENGEVERRDEEGS